MVALLHTVGEHGFMDTWKYYMFYVFTTLIVAYELSFVLRVRVHSFIMF